MRIHLRATIFGAALVALVAAGDGQAIAQAPYTGPGGYAPNNPPAYSPYLNLLRRGNSAAANYYGLVKPELEFRSAYRGLQQQVNGQVNATAAVDPQSGLPYTGHVATFLNTGGYFLNM